MLKKLDYLTGKNTLSAENNTPILVFFGRSPEAIKTVALKWFPL